MAPRLAWVLNFDAEMEMADPLGYRPSARMLTHCRRLTQDLLPSMARSLGAEPYLLPHPGSPAGESDLAGARCLAWAPTPSALAWMQRMGVEPIAHPGFDVLCRINHRSFLAQFQDSLDRDRDCLPGEVFLQELTQLELHLQGHGVDQVWLLKRAFGFAGRARKSMRAGALRSGTLTGAERTWVEASMETYGCGLQVEPTVDVQSEFGLHAWIGQAGEIHLGTLQVQVVDAQGAFVEARSCGEERSCDWIATSLERALLRLARRAAGEGYFGPLGIDAFLWKDAHAVLRLRVAGDLNARFSMGWFQGMEKVLQQVQPWQQ